MRNQELGDVRAEIGDTVTRLDPRCREGVCQARGRLRHLAIAESPVAMDYGGLVPEDLTAPTQE